MKARSHHWTLEVHYQGTTLPDIYRLFCQGTCQRVERATRHVYNALSKTWKKDDVFIKLQNEPFANGAMRVCFRMKKMNKDCPDADWKSDWNNYVAQRYTEDQ